MKRTYYLLILCVTFSAFILNGCNICVAVNGREGSGNVVKQTKTMPPFHAVVLETNGDVILTQTNEESVTIETDDNIMGLMETDIINGVLHISSKKTINPSRLTIWVNMKNIDGITVEGSGNIYAHNQIATDDINVLIEGSGNIDLKNLSTKNAGMVVSGSGDINVNGSCDMLHIRIDGSGDINCINFTSNIVNVQVNGSGDCKLNVISTLDAEINGSGDILYKGSPKELRTNVNGSGEIKKI